MLGIMYKHYWEFLPDEYKGFAFIYDYWCHRDKCTVPRNILRAVWDTEKDFFEIEVQSVKIASVIIIDTVVSDISQLNADIYRTFSECRSEMVLTVTHVLYIFFTPKRERVRRYPGKRIKLYRRSTNVRKLAGFISRSMAALDHRTDFFYDMRRIWARHINVLYAIAGV